MFIQLYTELCKYAINIDKGNMEREEVRNDKEELCRRKLAMSKTCVRMAFMLKEYDFRMSRICGLTAFALEPTMDNLNLVNKLYWTHKNVSAASKNSKIDIATLYEIERLLGLMRPESLNPEFSWKQLIPLCKKYKSDCESEKSGDSVGKSIVGGPLGKFFDAPVPMPNVINTTDTSYPGNARTKKPQLTTKDIEKAHLAKLLGQKNIPPDQIEQILSKHFPRNSAKELNDAPPLNMKQLDKTIDDLKKSIYLETEYRESMKQSLSSLQRTKKSDNSVHSNKSQNQHVSRMDQFRQLQQQQQQHSSQFKHSSVQRQHSVPGGSNSQGNNLMHRQTSMGSPQPPTAHSHHRQQQFSPVGFGGSPPPAHSTLNRISSPVGGLVERSTQRLVSPSELGSNGKHPHLQQSSHSKTVSEQLSKRIKEELARKQQQKTTLPFNILRPPGNDKQECAKIAQQIAELHEKQRAERERLENIRLQGHLDGVKAVLNSRNIASKSQISDLLTLTFQGNKILEGQTNLPNMEKHQGKSYQKKKTKNTPVVAPMNQVLKQFPSGTMAVPCVQRPVTGTNKQGSHDGTVSKPTTKKANTNILRQGEKMWDPKRGMMKQKYYLSAEGVKSTEVNQAVKTPTSDSNMTIKPVYSMIVPKSLTNPDRTEDLVTAVTNIIKHFPQGGNSVPRVAVHNSQTNNPQNVKTENVALMNSKEDKNLTSGKVNMSTPQNVLNQGTVGNQIHTNSVQLAANCNNTTLGMVSPNGLCIPGTGQSADVVPRNDNGILNLNTLANATVAVLGQAVNPQLGEQFQVSLQQPQQQINSVQESSQLLTTIQQVGQPPDSVYATPLFSVSQPLVLEPTITMPGIQPQINLNQSVLPQVISVQNQPITLDTGQVLGSASQQQASLQLNVSNNLSSTSVNIPHSVPATVPKQCIATPELSPAFVQQLLTSLKKKTAQGNNSELVQAQSETTQKIVKQVTSCETKQTPVVTKCDDKVMQKGVIEAQQKILQLREQYEKATGVSSEVTKKQFPGGLVAALVMDDSELAAKSKSNSTLQTFMSPVSSLTRSNVASTEQGLVPDLPDLGAKEFHIDDLLALDNEANKHVESLKQNNLGSSVKQSVAKVQNVSNVCVTSSSSKSGTTINTDMKQDRPQSTYFNANRLAKERESREAKTQDSNKLSKPCTKDIQGKPYGKCISCNLTFSSWKQLEDHKAKSNCGKPFKCDYCQMMFKSIELLNTHEKNYCLKAPMTVVKCHICGVYFESHEQLKAHLVPRTCSPLVETHNRLEPNSNDIVCGICGRKLESMTAMKEHVKKGCLKSNVKREFNLKDYEYEILFQCSHCNFKNSAERNLLKHIEKCKEKNPSANMMKLYRCRMCEEFFTVTDDICRHVSKQCPKLRVTNNQKHVQDTYQKLKNANMLHFDGDKSSNSMVSVKSDSRLPSTDERSSKNIFFSSEASFGKKQSNSRDTVSEIKTDVNVKSTDDLSVSKTLNAFTDMMGNTGNTKSGVDIKPVINDIIDETTIKLQKERRISAEKKFLAEFNEIEKRKKDIRMMKQREIAQKREALEKEEKERKEREKLELEKRKFMENILGKVPLQDKIKTDVPSQNIVNRDELTKAIDEVKGKMEGEIFSNDCEEKSSDQVLIVKSVNKNNRSLSRRNSDIKGEMMDDGNDAKEDKNTGKKRRKSEEEVENVGKTTKRQKGSHEPSSGSQKQSLSAKKKNPSPQDIRKLKGLRAKQLIKQKKYYMDEMDPVRPVKRNEEVAENKSPTLKLTNEKKKRSLEDELNENELKYLNKCRFCKMRNKPEFSKKTYIISHYVQKHKLGYKTVNYQYLCNFCGKKFPTSQTESMKYHVYKTHPAPLLKNVAKGKYDYFVGRVSPMNKKKNKFGINGNSPRKNEKIKKHMRALALRQKCAEKLKKIAMHAEDSDDSSEAEEVNFESTTSTDSEIIHKKKVETALSKSGRKIAPRLDRQLVKKSNSLKSKRLSQGSGIDSEENDFKRQLRSRSSSVSSNRSSIIVSAKKRKAAMTTMRLKSSSNIDRVLVTRSGRAVKRPDLRINQSTESSGVDEDTSEIEGSGIRKRKSARIRRLSSKMKSSVSEPSGSEESVSDEATPRVTRRSLKGQLNTAAGSVIYGSELTGRTRRSSVRNAEKSKENIGGQNSSRKEMRDGNVMSLRERRKFVREEKVVTRQSSKNEEESDSETEGSFTDTESTVKSLNSKTRRRGGEGSAESDSESTSYDDRRKRYRFRRRVSKRVYQEAESSETDFIKKKTNDKDEDSDFEFSDECEEFRSSDTRNSFEDDSNLSSRLGLQQTLMSKIVERPKTIMVGPDDDLVDTTSELHDEFTSQSSPRSNTCLFKSRPVVLAADNDDEFAGLSIEPMLNPTYEIIHSEKEEANQDLIKMDTEDRTTEQEVGKTLDEMLEIIPTMSKDIAILHPKKTKSQKMDYQNRNSTDSSQSSEYMNAYTEFIHNKHTPDRISSNQKLSSGCISEEHMKSAMVVVKDIALEGGLFRNKSAKEKLIEACLRQQCVVKINRLSENDFEKHCFVVKNENNVFEVDKISVLNSDEDSNQTEQYVPDDEKKIVNSGIVVKGENQCLIKKEDLSKADDNEVSMQDTDMTYSAAENTTNSSDSSDIPMNTDVKDETADAEIMLKNGKHDSEKAEDEMKNSSSLVENISSLEKMIGGDADSMEEKAGDEVSAVIENSAPEDQNEDVWIENAETYAEPINDHDCSKQSIKLENSEEQIFDDKGFVTCETNDSESQVKANETNPVVNEQEIIIDPSLSDNILCTIGNDNAAEETVLQIQMDGETDILQLVVESVSDGTTANIVVAENDVSIETSVSKDVLDCLDEKSIEEHNKTPGTAQVTLDCIADNSIGVLHKECIEADRKVVRDNSGESLESNIGNPSSEGGTENVDVAPYEINALECMKSESSSGISEEEILSTSKGDIVSQDENISVSLKHNTENFTVESTTDVNHILQERSDSPVNLSFESEVINVNVKGNETVASIDKTTEMYKDVIECCEDLMTKIVGVLDMDKKSEYKETSDIDYIRKHITETSHENDNALKSSDTLNQSVLSSGDKNNLGTNTFLRNTETYYDYESDSDIELIDIVPDADSSNELEGLDSEEMHEAVISGDIDDSHDNTSLVSVSSNIDAMLIVDGNSEEKLVNMTSKQKETSSVNETGIFKFEEKESRNKMEQVEETQMDVESASHLTNSQEREEFEDLNSTQTYKTCEIPDAIDSNDQDDSASKEEDASNRVKGFLAEVNSRSEEEKSTVETVDVEMASENLKARYISDSGCSEIYEQSRDSCLEGNNQELNESTPKATDLMKGLDCQQSIQDEAALRNVGPDPEDFEVENVDEKHDHKLNDINLQKANIQIVERAGTEIEDTNSIAVELPNDKTGCTVAESFNNELVDSASNEFSPLHSSDKESSIVEEVHQDSVIENEESFTDNKSPELIENNSLDDTLKIGLNEIDDSENISVEQDKEISNLLPIVKDNRTVSAKIPDCQTEGSTKYKIEDKIVNVVLADGGINDSDVCIETVDTQSYTEEVLLKDMNAYSPDRCVDVSKEMGVSSQRFEYGHSVVKAEISTSEYEEPCNVDSRDSMKIETVMSKCDEDQNSPEIHEDANTGLSEKIYNEANEDVGVEISQEMNYLEETADENSDVIPTKTLDETSIEMPDGCDIYENVAGKINDSVMAVTSPEMKEEICSVNPIEIFTESTILDNLSLITQPSNLKRKLSSSSSELSLIRYGSDSEGDTDKEKSLLNESAEQESLGDETAASPDVKAERNGTETVIQQAIIFNKEMNERTHDSCDETKDTNINQSSQHEVVKQENDQCILLTGNENLDKSVKKFDTNSSEEFNEGKPDVVHRKRFDEKTVDISVKVVKEIVPEDTNVADDSTKDCHYGNDEEIESEDTNVVDDASQGNSGTVERSSSFFPVFRRKGMVCVQVRQRTKTKEESHCKKDSNKKISKIKNNDKKVQRDIKSKSYTPQMKSKLISAAKNHDDSNLINKTSVCLRSHSGGNKLSKNNIDYVTENSHAVNSLSPSIKSTLSANRSAVKRELGVKTRSLSPDKSHKIEASNQTNVKNLVVREDAESKSQTIETKKKVTCKKNTNHEGVLESELCDKTSVIDDKSKINVKKEKTTEAKRQQSDDATVGNIFKRVKFPVVAANCKDTITHQREDETDEEFRRRTENVRQARRKSAAKSYESDFNFDDGDTKCANTNSTLQSTTFWQSDSDTNYDATSFYSNSSGTSGSHGGARDGKTKLNQRLARDFGQDDAMNSSMNSPVSKSHRGSAVASSSRCEQQGKSNIEELSNIKSFGEKSLSEKLKTVSAACKLGSKSMHLAVQDLTSGLKDEVSMGDVHDSRENLALGKVKALRALHKDGRPFKWEENPSPPKKRRSQFAEEITNEVRNIIEKDRKNNMKSLPSNNKMATTETVIDHSDKRILRAKKGKYDASYKEAISKKEGLDLKKLGDEPKKTVSKKVNENKTNKKTAVRTRSMSGSLERMKSNSGKTVDKSHDGEMPINADFSKRIAVAKPSPHGVTEENLNKTVKHTRSLRSLEASDVNCKLNIEINAIASGDKTKSESLMEDQMEKVCKLDGTSTSPEMVNLSVEQGADTGSPDDSFRPACRQVIHGGKMFEIQRGCVRETDLQDLSMKTTRKLKSSTQSSPTLPESVVIKRSRRISDQRKLALSAEGIVDSNMCPNSGSTDINKYIKETLKDIKKLRSNQNSSPWTFQKSAGGTRRSQKTFPYAFKKT